MVRQSRELMRESHPMFIFLCPLGEEMTSLGATMAVGVEERGSLCARKGKKEGVYFIFHLFILTKN